ncbi:hypothetical protein GT346_04515, partial [Streptomyces sp. SID161]|nr:hypothetical protein [Streptomyces sp. SID161]
QEGREGRDDREGREGRESRDGQEGREPDRQEVPFDEDAAWRAIVAGYGQEPPDPPGARPFRRVEDLALPEPDPAPDPAGGRAKEPGASPVKDPVKDPV